MTEQRIISMELAHRIWSAHREIEIATKLLNGIEETLERGEAPTPLDAFGRRRGYQLGVPSSDNSQRCFDVAPTLAREVMRAHIAAKQAELGVLCHEAAIELGKDGFPFAEKGGVGLDEALAMAKSIRADIAKAEGRAP